jgi:hypothetical protein
MEQPDQGFLALFVAHFSENSSGAHADDGNF